MSGEFNRDNTATDGNETASPGNDSSPLATAPSQVPANAAPISGISHGPPKPVEDVMSSDIGINTLLSRLKQSIASARDFAAFLKKRSSLEEEQAQGLKRLVKAQMDNSKRSEIRGQTYVTQLSEIMRCHDRMGDNGMQFALSLHQMHEDLTELSNNIEKGRKQWKHEGLDAEKRASDAESAMQKARARYDSLAEEYDRARTGDLKGSRRLGLKGPKSAEQHESDLLRKVQQADADYEEKVKQAQTQRESLLRDGRPRAVRALRELCTECDSGLTLQLQKFATFNEKLLLGNGISIYPINGGHGRSLRDVVAAIDNDYDFNSFVGSHSVPPRPVEIKYEKHPTLAPKTQPLRQQTETVVPSHPPNLTLNTAGPPPQSGPMNNRFAGPSPGGPVLAASQPQAYNDSPAQYSQPNPPYPVHAPSPANLASAPPRDGTGASLYPSYANERSASLPLVQTVGSIPIAPPQPFAGTPTSASENIMPPTTNKESPLSRPVFGVSLEELFNRDQSAVPIVIIQCILAVDTYGLDSEGIYRQSGNAAHVNSLRDQFDHNQAGVDFRHPANFYHDINSVATLLKAFFRELPDPLFTRVGYDSFVEAARVEDDTARRDALHQSINDLPDPNYATLRVLVLHLRRVMQHESRTRMTSSNLAMCLAPTRMGQHTGAQIADASLQTRVLDTILLNATAIFDED